MADNCDMIAHASISVEAVMSEKPRHGEEVKSDDGATESQISKEQFMHISVMMPALKQPTSQDKTHLILVVDKSGSMAGNAWKQVQGSLKDIIGQTVGRTDLKAELIIYADNAKIIDFNGNNYEQVIDGLSAGGTTNFKAAFVKLLKVMMVETDQTYKQTVVVFMTDGCDTAYPQWLVPTLVPKLREKLREMQTESIIHAVGFTADHNFTFLKELAETGGKKSGLFRYCEPSDGQKALQDKLDELFDFILLGNNENTTMTVGFEDENNLILNHGKPSPTAILKTQKVAENETDSKDIQLACETWVQLKDPSGPMALSLNIQTNILQNGETKPVTIPCIIDNTEFKLLETNYEKTQWRLRILQRNVDELVKKATEAITEKKETAHIQSRIEKYQSMITHIQVFGNGITKETREKLFVTIKEIQGTLDQVQSMLAEYIRTGTNSVSLLARAHDLRYKAVFSKSRRQRTMDKRASKNMAYAATAQETLSNLVIDKQEVDQLSQDALGFYFCVLSQNSIRDVLLGDDKEDAIGFGLAVKRSEVALDEPTMMKVFVISGTLVSRTAMLDALEYKINVSSHLKAHGGFSFEDKALGVTTVGASREPINAWLPLYVCKSHWDRVKVILKPALGSFCTLDPLGYHYKQLDVMFMVLGSMIGKLNEENVGEHQLKLLFAVQRTCAACMVDFELTKDISNIVEQFILNPGGRTRDIVAHLYTLIGYVVSLPVDIVRKIFKMEEENNSIRQFWLAFIAEWLRRAAGAVYKDSKKPVLNGYIHAVLNGDLNDNGGEINNTQEATSELVRMCLDNSVTEEDMNIEPFDPTENVKEPTIELVHDQKIDRAMEIWAEKTTGHQKPLFGGVSNIEPFDPTENAKEPTIELIHDQKIDRAMENWAEKTTEHQKNLGKTGKYKDALRVVRSWNQGGAAIMGDYIESANQRHDKEKGEESGAANQDDESEDETEIENENQSDAKMKEKTVTSQFDCQAINRSMLKYVAQLQHKVCRVAYPGLETLPGCIAFVNNWLSRQYNMDDLDNNSGLVPDSWVQEVKVAVRETCETIYDFTSDQFQDKEVFVVSTDNTAQDSENINAVAETDPQTISITTKVQDTKIDDKDNSGNHGNQPEGSDKNTKKAKEPRKVCLPAVLHYVDPNMEVVQMMRALLCQVISYHSNSMARSAISSNEFVDLSGGNTNSRTLLEKCDWALEDYKHTAQRNIFEKVVWKRANYCMIRASTPWAFVGYLMNTYSTRSEGFIDLIDFFLATITKGEIPPYLQEKIHILFTGKYKDQSVLEKGNQMLPVGKLAEKVTDIIGQEAWNELNRELRSTVSIHVYRESDIPNRHGHCNSNPYIPNALRLKLGMPLMPENYRNRLKRRRQR